MTLPIAGSLRGRSSQPSEDLDEEYENYRQEIFLPFVVTLANALPETMKINPICKAFACLDVQNHPRDSEMLETFGEDNLDSLLDWYGTPKTTRSTIEDFPVLPVLFDPIVDANEAKREFENFKKFGKKLRETCSSKWEKEVQALERKIKTISNNRHDRRDQRKREKLEKELKEVKERKIGLQYLYRELSNPLEVFMPNMKRLLLLANLSPIGNAVVERWVVFIHLQSFVFKLYKKVEA